MVNSKKKKDLTPDEVRELLERAYQMVAQTDEGRIVLRHVLALSGYQLRLVRTNPVTGEVNVEGTTYGVARRDLWVDLRGYLSREELAKIENGEE